MGISTREAEDLWSQMLERARTHEWSTFEDPDYVAPGREPDVVKKRYIEAGWTPEYIEQVNFISKMQSENAPSTSPGVARFTESMLHILSSKVKNAAELMDLPGRDKVHFVVEPKAGPLITKINVIMTDQSIITMGSFFTRYCGLIARAYIRTMALAPLSLGIDFNERFFKSELRKRPDLLVYWWRIFISFALTGTHALSILKPSKMDEIALMEQVALSMETFGISHEYGHHVLGHGRSVSDAEDSHREEFEADAFALKMSTVVEAEERKSLNFGRDLPNPYLWTGAGGILLLSSLEVFRKVKESIFSRKAFDTHPSFSTRSSKIRNTYVLQPYQYMTSQDFCLTTENVMRCVMEELEPIMKGMAPKYQNLLPEDWEARSFE